jgi:hypothetical protein
MAAKNILFMAVENLIFNFFLNFLLLLFFYSLQFNEAFVLMYSTKVGYNVIPEKDDSTNCRNDLTNCRNEAIRSFIQVTGYMRNGVPG